MKKTPVSVVACASLVFFLVVFFARPPTAAGAHAAQEHGPDPSAGSAADGASFISPAIPTYPTSWVAYSLLVPPANSTTITSLSFSFDVPDSPTYLFGPTSPGWYACLLTRGITMYLRPTVAWGVVRSEFSAFFEVFREDNHFWWQSQVWHVLSSDTIDFSVSLAPSASAYNLTMSKAVPSSVNWTTLFPLEFLDSTPFTALAIVMDHEPRKCTELPTQDVHFNNITVTFDHGKPIPLSAASWDTFISKKRCSPEIATKAGDSLTFSWDSSSTPDTSEGRQLTPRSRLHQSKEQGKSSSRKAQ